MSVAVAVPAVTATFLIFAAVIFVFFMVTTVSIIVIVTTLSFAVAQMIRNLRVRQGDDLNVRRMIFLLCIVAIVTSLGMIIGKGNPFRLLMEIHTSLMAMFMLNFSLNHESGPDFSQKVFPILLLLMAAYYLLSLTGLVPMPSEKVCLAVTDLVAMSSSVIFVLKAWSTLRDVKSVMRSGNSWSFLTLCVDAAYMLLPLAILMLLHALYALLPSASETVAICAVLLLHLELMAVCVRISYDSAFALLHNHERVIVESMKISTVDVASSPDSKRESQYRELYERICNYFDTYRPYLDGNLTINDIVKVVYSNKVYISKAICHFTGRNFRQFVNYHRVMYSVALFRDNLEFKVAELAERSGFNNVVTYTMAFRLFMDDTPSDWCRKERSKILKPKK